MANKTKTNEYPYDTHHGVVINRAKFGACIYSSFRGVKADTQNCGLFVGYDRQTYICFFCTTNLCTSLFTK